MHYNREFSSLERWTKDWFSGLLECVDHIHIGQLRRRATSEMPDVSISRNDAQNFYLFIVSAMKDNVASDDARAHADTEFRMQLADVGVHRQSRGTWLQSFQSRQALRLVCLAQ